ncbi:MAG TPA: ABC transporter permease [Vicinamibacterales bacterium]|nr:ABC transporter permease [Vicinamibacterales bacterium]
MPETWFKDVRYAARLLARSPLFAATAALSLAIGIGANTAIFSVASALLLRPLPGLSDAAGLVDIGRTQNGRGFDNTSYPNYADVRERVTTLTDVYAIRLEPQPMSLAGNGGAERVYGTAVSGNYFSVLGTQPVRGRFFTDADDTIGSAPATVISYELWQRRFAADPAIVGRTVTLTNEPFTVIGIAPRGFQGTTLLRTDVWVTLHQGMRSGPSGTDMFTNRRAVWLLMGGRLKPGVTLTQADAELRAIGTTLAREYPAENEGRGLTAAASAVVPGRVNYVAAFLGLLMAIVGLILLIACVNVAGMLLARAAARRREIAVRLAVGAGRARLVRQFLTETIVLFAAGGALGLLLSRWLTSLLLALLPQLPIPIGIEIATDWRVVLFAVAMCLAAALLAGLAPALQASRASLVPSLKAEGLDDGLSRLRLRNAFVVGQITLSLLLVIAAGLFLRALGHAVAIQPGFDARNVDVVAVDLSLGGYGQVEGLTFADELVRRTAALPGVRSAVLAVDLPLDGSRMGFGDLQLPGTPRQSGPRRGAPIDWNIVTPGFFRTLDVRLLRGRDFTSADAAGAPRVAILNEAAAHQYFGDADPLGRQLEIVTPFGDDHRERVTIVGVADNAQFVSLGDTTSPYVYVPLAQQYFARLSLVVKTAGATAIPSIRTLMREMNPNLPVTSAMPLTDITALGLIPQRIAAAVAGTLGLVGLLLAAIGIYGVTSYAVSRRTREIGIRIALGADRRGVVAIVLRQALVLTAIGLVIGLAFGAAAAQLLRSLLFGISAVDPLTFGGAAVLFVVVALAASYIPARRATRLDPVTALRSE